MTTKQRLTRQMMSRLILIIGLLLEISVFLIVFCLAIPLQYRRLGFSMIENKVKVKEQTVSLPQLLFAPDEYKMQSCLDTRLHLVSKENWHYEEEAIKSTRTCYISIEPLSEFTGYKTGLRAQIIYDVLLKTELEPQEYARLYIRRQAESQPVSTQNPVIDTKNFKIYSALVKQPIPESNSERTILHSALVNKKTGTVYLISYQSEGSEWDNHSNAMRTMLENIIVPINY